MWLRGGESAQWEVSDAIVAKSRRIACKLLMMASAEKTITLIKMQFSPYKIAISVINVIASLPTGCTMHIKNYIQSFCFTPFYCLVQKYKTTG